MFSLTDKLNTLKSFDLVNLFPTTDLKISNKIEKPNFFGEGSVNLAKSIENFLNDNYDTILKTANARDLKAIEGNLTNLNNRVNISESHEILQNAVYLVKTLQEQKSRSSSTPPSLPPRDGKARIQSEKKPLPKVAHEKKGKSKEAILQEIQNDLQKIDLGSPQGLKQVKELSVKVSQAKKHPNLNPNNGHAELVDLEAALEMILNPAAFTADNKEKIIINMFRNDGVEDLKKEIKTHLNHIKKSPLNQLPTLKSEFIKALKKYEKSEHLTGTVTIIIRDVQKLSDNKYETLKPLHDEAMKVLDNHCLDCSVYDRQEKTLAKNATNEVLKLLKKSNLLSNTSLFDDLLKIKSQALKSRISNISSPNPSFDLNKILDYIEKLKVVEEKTQTYLQTWIEKIHKTFDAHSNNKFSELIKNYGYINLKGLSPDIIKFILKISARSLKNNNPLTDEKTHELINKILNKHKLNYQWLLVNLPYIEKPYNQGNDYNRNQDNGTCYENSCDREAILLDTPEIDSKDISMGSSSGGRFIEATLEAAHSKNEALSQEACIDQYLDETLGLKISGREKLVIPNNNTNNSRQYVVDQLCNQGKFPPSTLKAMILIMNPSSLDCDEGHAINVQIIRDKHIYRFIDDNLGIVKYPTEAQFQKHFKRWLEITYPELDDFFVLSVKKK